MDTNYYKKYEPFFNSWYIKRQIGEGSFGKVYEIEREDFGRTYKAALKVITIPQNKSEVKSAMAEGMDEQSTRSYFRGLVEELINEFDIMSKVKGNTNIVSYEDHAVFEHTDGIGWDIVIRMELLTPLLDYVREKPFAEKDVIKMGCDICSALEVCRRHNIIHRDIKPENIFVSEDGNFKLGDFGISRTVERTTSGLSKKGTYTYMAPEVYKGQPYNASVDIYSLGIVLYRFLNQSRTPFMPEYPTPITYTDREIALEKRIKGETIPVIRNITPGLSNIVLKACSYNPDNRYATPEEFKQALSGISSTTANYQYNPVNTSVDRTEAFFTQTDARTQGIFVDTTSGFERTEAFNDDFSTIGTRNDFDINKDVAPAESKNNKKFFIAGIIGLVVAVIIGLFAYVQIHNYKVENGLISNVPTEQSSPCIITMGSYEQDNNTANGPEPIEWYVLDEKDGKILLFSKNALELLPYNTAADTENSTWENSTLRRWLNEVFINEAFSEEEKECIMKTALKTINQYEGWESGPQIETTDKVFLLTGDEYFDYSDKTGLPLFLYKSLYTREKDINVNSNADISEWYAYVRDGEANGSYHTWGPEWNFKDEKLIYPALWVSVNDDYFKEVLEPIAITVDDSNNKKVNIIWAESSGGYFDDFGLNDYNEFVYWKIAIQLENSNSIENISCSWDNITDITNETHIEGRYPDYGWKSAKAGNSHYEVESKSLVEIVLPDDKSIEGQQIITIDDATISFNLESLGDYSTGTGWNITNVEIN